MKEIIVNTTNHCGYCNAAKNVGILLGGCLTLLRIMGVTHRRCWTWF